MNIIVLHDCVLVLVFFRGVIGIAHAQYDRIGSSVILNYSDQCVIKACPQDDQFPTTPHDVLAFELSRKILHAHALY